MTWATEADLLVGDMAFGETFEKSKYLNDAEDEILVRLGRIYTLPLPTLNVHMSTVLKQIQSRLASGRLIMAASGGGESHDLHAYGRDLVRMAYEELARIGRDYEIENAVRYGVGENRAPSATNFDATSPFDTYSDFAHGGNAHAYWTPGA